MTAPTRERILPRLIEDEMRESFLDYSMSVIVQRALPDVRDGLKPVHRRILSAMHALALVAGRPPNSRPHSRAGPVQPRHHLGDGPDRSLPVLRRFIKGPDCPPAAIICGREGTKECREKGRGRMLLRARAVVEAKECTGKQQI